MPLFTTNSSGAADVGGTWVGGVVPSPTDDWAVATGHVLTVPAGVSMEVGGSPDDETTFGLEVQGTGRLIINGTLRARTNARVVSGGSIEVVHTGSVAPPEFIVDASHRPTTKRHHCRLGSTGTGRLILTGLGPTQRAYMSGGTAAFWYHNGTTTGQGQFQSSYGYVTRGQNAGDAFGRFWLGGSIGSTASLDCSDTIFDACGTFTLKADAGKTITWARNKWMNSITRANLGDGGLAATSVCILDNNVFDRSPQLSGIQLNNSAALRGSNNYAHNGWGQATGTGQWEWTIKENESGDFNLGPFQGNAGTDTRYIEWLIQSDPTLTNPHITSLSGNRIGGGYLYQVHTSLNGEGCIPTTVDGVTCTISDLLLLPSFTGEQGMTLASFLANVGGAAANGETNLYHITAPVSGTSSRAVMCGETNDTPTNTVRNLRSIQAYDGVTPTTSGGLIYLTSAQTSNDPVDATGVDYNWTNFSQMGTRALIYGGKLGGVTATQTIPTAANDIIQVDHEYIDNSRRSEACAAWLGARLGATGDNTTTPGIAATQENFRLLFKNMWTGEFFDVSNPDVVNACQLAIQWVTRGYIARNEIGRGLGHDGLTSGYFGAWAPRITPPVVTGQNASWETNCADGTAYWVVTQSSTPPDWDRLLAGKDHTGTTVPAGYSGNHAVSSLTPTTDFSSAVLGAGTYYLHLTQKSAGTEALLEDYLHTTEPVTSASFQGSGGAQSVRRLALKMSVAI